MVLVGVQRCRRQHDRHQQDYSQRWAPLVSTTVRCEEASQSRISDPFMWNDLTAGLLQRQQRAGELNAFAQRLQLRAYRLAEKLKRNEISRVNFDMSMHALRQSAIQESARIIYSVEDPHARQRFLEQYGSVKATPQAIQAIKRLEIGVIELGAGSGHWNLTLCDNGVDVVSFDSMEHLPTSHISLGTVNKGDESVLARYGSSRALLLVYPPPGDTALKCIRAFAGTSFIYVGEGRGGANANEAFFDMLMSEWSVQEFVVLEDTFPRCYERMWILKKK